MPKIKTRMFRVYRIEQLEYESTQFFSDVGGAAGLLLGLSFTSLFGMIDFVVSTLRAYYEKKRIKRIN